MKIFACSIGFLLITCLAVGCTHNAEEESPDENNPLPVETQTLSLSEPPQSAFVSASVGSWKTEQIGFEVSGRIEWVAEPKDEIEGRVFSSEPEKSDASTKTGNPTETVQPAKAQTPLIEGNPVARIENERYALQVEISKKIRERADYDVATAEGEKKALISQKEAAVAELNFFEGEFTRINDLKGLDAVSKSELERARADRATASGKVSDIEAQISAKKSKILSLGTEVLQARESLLNAERDLDNCELYSSFRGQVAEVFVVPGSYVTAGSPVATIQMMDPIQIELEVSAEDSRKLRNRIEVPVFVSQTKDDLEDEELFRIINGRLFKRVSGFLYMIDPVADPQTRTFTVTLLVLNQKTSVWSPENKHLPATDRPRWLNLPFIPGAQPGVNKNGETVGYADVGAIRKDEHGSFLWRVTNMEKHKDLPEHNRLVVTKMHVGLGTIKLPFLGNWWFQEVIIPAAENFDPKKNIVAGNLYFHSESRENADSWVGGEVLVDRESKWGGSWMLRPGDVVKVDLSGGDKEKGYFVPMEAIVHESGKTYLFVVEPKNENTGQMVRRIEIGIVQATDITSSLQQIEEIGESLDGLKYVTRGAHYLVEGESVVIVPTGATE